jgi:hypothetical protein
MARRLKLREIAHARAGDKGDTSSIALIVYDLRHFALIRDYVTPERVKAHFGPLVLGDVRRYELPQLGALNFVLQGALAGGVTRSLALDIHGKSRSSLLLELELLVDEAPRDVTESDGRDTVSR